MTYFNRGGFGGNRSGGFSSRGGSDRGERPALHDAICAKCGSACQVPFKPNGRKEVFCSKCFEEVSGGESRDRGTSRFENRGSDRGFGGESRGQRSFDKPMFNAICDECGDNCTVPFEPRNGKPVLCSNCFAKKDSRGARPAAASVDLSELNAKLDKIIKLLTPVTPKDISEKIIETIEANSGKEVAPVKKKAKVAKKKVEVKE